MTANTKTFAFGQLETDGDTWFLVKPDGFLLLDAALSDISLEHKMVSVVGKMGFPPSNPAVLKLIVEKIVSHDNIAVRAFDIFQSAPGGSQDDHWLRAERELLGLSTTD
jgi:hypothetical protein